MAGLLGLLLCACATTGRGDETLPPLPLPPVIRTTTTTSIPVVVADPPEATALAPPTSAPESTTVPAATTSVSATTVSPTTTTPAATTSPPVSTLLSDTSTTTAVVTGVVGPWIMQLASASASTTDQAIAAALNQFRAVAPGVTTLRTADWPNSFSGTPVVIFYVGGFASRDEVLAQCAALGLPSPAKCLPRQIGTG